MPRCISKGMSGISSGHNHHNYLSLSWCLYFSLIRGCPWVPNFPAVSHKKEWNSASTQNLPQFFIPIIFRGTLNIYSWIKALVLWPNKQSDPPIHYYNFQYLSMFNDLIKICLIIDWPKNPSNDNSSYKLISKMLLVTYFCILHSVFMKIKWMLMRL